MASTNTSTTKVKFTRTYSKYQPSASTGPSTEILATVLNPA